jgi:hypothetical protein
MWNIYSIFSPKKRWVRKKRKKVICQCPTFVFALAVSSLLDKRGEKVVHLLCWRKKRKNIPAKRDKLQSVWNLK